MIAESPPPKKRKTHSMDITPVSIEASPLSHSALINLCSPVSSHGSPLHSSASSTVVDSPLHSSNVTSGYVLRQSMPDPDSPFSSHHGDAPMHGDEPMPTLHPTTNAPHWAERLASGHIELIQHSPWCDEFESNLSQLSKLQRSGFPSGLPLGSACSGTDLVVPGNNLLFACLADALRFDSDHDMVVMDSKWSCESDPMKQQWLLLCMNSPKVFSDICRLHERCCLDMRSQTEQSVDPIFEEWIGFSCKSVSFANTKRKLFAGLKSSRGTTGVTYRAGWKSVQKLLPFYIFLENVKGLTKQARLEIIEDFWKLGYVMVCVVCDGSKHGLHQRRVRVWFLGSLNPHATQAERDAAQQQAEEMEEFLQFPPGDIRDILMTAEDDKWFACLTKLQHTRHHPSTKIEWKKKHKAMWKGLTSTDKIELRGKLARAYVKEIRQDFDLSEREADIVKFDRVSRSEDYRLHRDAVLLDISQSIDRVPRGRGISPTVLPSGKLWVHPTRTGLNLGLCPPRPVFGLETLRLQGLCAQTMIEGADMMDQFTHANLVNLAGNAFSTSHVVLAKIIAITLFRPPVSRDAFEGIQEQARAKFKRRRWTRLTPQ